MGEKKLMLVGKDESIVFFICDKNKKLQQLRRAGMEASFSTLKTLLRQWLLIGRRDSFESNFYQFNKDKAEHVTDLNFLMKEKKYMSNDIVAEMEKMLVLSARRQILRSINGKQFFSLITDESADIFKTEQVSLSFQTASETCDVKEEFIGIMPCKEGLTADVLLSYITDVFIRYGVNNDKLITMSFDGSLAMKSLAEKLKNCYGQQVSYIHCLAHCTKSVAKDTTSSSELLQLAVCTLKKMYTFLAVLEKLSKELRTVKFAANQVIHAFEKTKHPVKNMRCEEEF